MIAWTAWRNGDTSAHRSPNGGPLRPSTRRISDTSRLGIMLRPQGTPRSNLFATFVASLIDPLCGYCIH